MVNNIAVLIGTHDQYRAAWPAMHHSLTKYFPDCPWPIYWVTNQLDPPCGTGLKVGGGKVWGTNMRKALHMLDSEVVLFMPEDTWMTGKVNTEALVEFATYITDDIVDHIRLVNSDAVIHLKDYTPDPRLWIYASNSPYRTSCCPGLWRRDVMRKLIRNTDTAWSFEKQAPSCSRDYLFLCTYASDYIPYVMPVGGAKWAWSPIKRGKWTPGARLWAEVEGVEVDFSKHPKDY